MFFFPKMHCVSLRSNNACVAMFVSFQSSSSLPLSVHCYSFLGITTTNSQLVKQWENSCRNVYRIANGVFLFVCLFCLFIHFKFRELNASSGENLTREPLMRIRIRNRFISKKVFTYKGFPSVVWCIRATIRARDRGQRLRAGVGPRALHSGLPLRRRDGLNAENKRCLYVTIKNLLHLQGTVLLHSGHAQILKEKRGEKNTFHISIYIILQSAV